MICPKCNKQIDDNLNFCSNCGTNLKIENKGSSEIQSTSTGSPEPYQPSVSGTPNNQQFPTSSSSYQQSQGSFQPVPNYGGPMDRPIGLALIALYEILFGVLMSFLGIVLFFLGINSQPQQGGFINLNLGPLIAMIGILILAWGILGLVSGTFFFQWKKSGYLLSLIFLVSSGVVLFSLYFIPSIVMVISLIYFFTNQNFKNAIKYMEFNRR